MTHRPYTDSASARIRGYSPAIETLEGRQMPILGGKRSNPLAGRLAFWRNLALVLVAFNLIRLAVDLLHMAN